MTLVSKHFWVCVAVVGMVSVSTLKYILLLKLFLHFIKLTIQTINSPLDFTQLYCNYKKLGNHFLSLSL